MKANEYIKNYGWTCAGIRIAEIEHSKDFDGFYSDLKRLVESYELVEKNQGLNGARNVLKLLEASLDIGLYHGIDGVDATTEVPKLRQAIADVESCMEVNDGST